MHLFQNKTGRAVLGLAAAAMLCGAYLAAPATPAQAEAMAVSADSPAPAPAPAAAALNSKIANVLNKKGQKIGMVEATAGPHGVMLDISVNSMPPGKHGMHMHAVGSCDPDTGFKSAGGHINTMDKGHGLLYADGPHEGDLPNLVVNAEGYGAAQVFSHTLTWDLLSDEDGAALIIHEGTDDHMTQPLGGSGGRAACAAFAPAEPAEPAE